MSHRSIFRLGAALAAALVAGGIGIGTAGAEDAPAAAPAPAAGKWIKVCNTDPATNKELCLVTQELRADTGQFIVSATLRQFTGDPKISFIVAVPPGLLLQPGLQTQVDDNGAQAMKYGICFPNACYAEAAVDDAFIASLKKGNQLTVTALNQQGKPVSFPLTLSGFTKSYDGAGLDAQAAQAAQQELNAALQRRAEEARQRLIQQQQEQQSSGQ
jgi:invasion protein IalB